MAVAYSLREHEWVTRRAVLEFSQCAGVFVDEGLITAAIEGNLDEDINTMRKWFAYSHYYNPYKPIVNDHRKDALARVRQIAEKFKEPSEMNVLNPEFFSRAGRLMHYVQDVTGPAHVVPVRHSDHEGFEGYKIENLDALFDKMSPSSCGDQTGEFFALDRIFDDTARMTLQTLGGKFLVNCAGMETPYAWNQVWVGHEGPYYGHYGALGNIFGEENFLWQGQSCRVDLRFYDDYKLRQLRMAVDSSRLVLEWIWRWQSPNPLP